MGGKGDRMSWSPLLLHVIDELWFAAISRCYCLMIRPRLHSRARASVYTRCAFRSGYSILLNRMSFRDYLAVCAFKIRLLGGYSDTVCVCVCVCFARQDVDVIYAVFAF